MILPWRDWQYQVACLLVRVYYCILYIIAHNLFIYYFIWKINFLYGVVSLGIQFSFSHFFFVVPNHSYSLTDYGPGREGPRCESVFSASMFLLIKYPGLWRLLCR